MTPAPRDTTAASANTAASTASTASTHWVVRMNYRNRAGSWLMAFSILALYFQEQGYGLWHWGFMSLQFLVYPHLVYLRARRAADPLAAEIWNLRLDSFCFGIWTAVLGGPLWICFTLIICGCINLAAFAAGRGVLQALGAAMGGALLTLALGGAASAFKPETSMPVSLLCMAALAVYLILFAQDAHQRTVALHNTRLKLRQSESALQERLEAIQALQGQLSEQANRDPLTGLYNRRYLDDTLQRELDRCAREGLPLSLLLIDLDHFKQINDQHGHAAGDAVLCQVSALLLQHMRSSDICCRWGGEEFLLVLPGVGLEAAAERAELFRLEAAQARHMPCPLTLSIGVSACTADAGTAPAALIERADRALYRAKAEGRNRVCVAGRTGTTTQTAP